MTAEMNATHSSALQRSIATESLNNIHKDVHAGKVVELGWKSLLSFSYIK